MSPKTLLRLFAVLFAFTLVAVACGSSDDGDAGSGDDTADEAATGDGTEAPTESTEGPTESTEAPTESSEPAGDPEPTNGFDGETITLGFLTDESGALAILGRPLAVGSQTYWDYVNAEMGGVGGRYPVELAVGDTKDDSGAAVQEYQRLKDDAVLFAQILSTPPTQAVLEFLRADNIVGVPGSLAGAWALEDVMLPNGAAYEYEMINIADWFVNDSGLGSTDTVQCVISVDDAYGESGLAGLEYAADQLGFTLVERQTMSRGDSDFSATVASLSSAGCEAVYAITVPTEQDALLAQALADGFEPIWLGALPAYLNLFASGNPDRYANLYVTLDAPDFNDTSVPGMAKFLEVWGEYGEGDPDTFLYSGYFQQISVHALLEKAVELGDLSRDGISAAMAALGEVESDGLVAENYVYGLAADRMPTQAVRIFQFDPDNPPNLVTEVTVFDSSLNDDYELQPLG